MSKHLDPKALAALRFRNSRLCADSEGDPDSNVKLFMYLRTHPPLFSNIISGMFCQPWKRHGSSEIPVCDVNCV